MAPRVKGLSCIALLCVACGGGFTSPSRLVGSYTLRDINGKAPPQRISAVGPDTAWLLSAMISLGADGRASINARSRESHAGVASDTAIAQSGTWVLVNGTIEIESTTSVLAPFGVLLGYDDGRTWLTRQPRGESVPLILGFDRYVNIMVIK